ncbi:probable mitochondrial import inner membrane translocase subunit TIM21 [Coffea eugenioides]|uniref:probable mitochondrial import inner membrane translocase subunit TIM21 n=1 Tax=Coffea eugenioides TaxID=49369 RepID=UPI000F605FA7|nr:probable mitochondrial import inner membrane translocase subunit TIM21 [Coffea eugenioides]
MQHLRRTGFLLLKNNRLSTALKSCNGLGDSFLDYMPTKYASNMGFAPFSSTCIGEPGASSFVRREMMNNGAKYVRDGSYAPRVKHEAGGLPLLLKKQWTRRNFITSQSSFQPAMMSQINSNISSSARSFSSKASDSKGQNESETRKDMSTVEDPFDAPTYNIPEKPVTFVEGASYTVFILAGLGVAIAAAYAVLTELVFEPKEYKIFGKALERVQNDSQVRVRIGSPITGYGSESRNRAARQRIPNRIWTKDGVEHVAVDFYIRGPHGAGKVYAEMFKDEDKQWKFVSLVVELTSPSRQMLLLESYIPA